MQTTFHRCFSLTAIKRPVLFLFLVTGLWAMVSSFTSRPGGEGFEIYADGQLLLQRFGSDVANAQPLALTKHSNGNLYIKYFHCGKTGTNRVITLKDQHQNVLRAFPYADSKAEQGVMRLDIAAIRALVKGNEPVQLFYSSAELKNGRMLTTISF